MFSDPLRERCQLVARRVLKDNGWELVSADDKSFVQKILDRIVDRFPAVPKPASEITDDLIIRATKNAYCAVLYQAYKDDGSEEQMQAMTEVKNYVYRRLLALTQGDGAMADECAQDAMTQAWLHWHRVRDPGTFLGYVQRIGVHRVLDLQRRDERLEPLSNGNAEQRNGPEFSTPGRQLEQMTEASDLFRRAYAAIERCLSRPEEVRIIVEHLILDRPYKELARAWGKQASYLHLLKFRALEKLAKCKEFVDLRREWLDGRQSESRS